MVKRKHTVFVLAGVFLGGCSGESGVQVPVQSRTSMAQQQPLELRIQSVMGNPHLSDSQKQAIVAKMRSKASASPGVGN